jgi:hypothetical protein
MLGTFVSRTGLLDVIYEDSSEEPNYYDDPAYHVKNSQDVFLLVHILLLHIEVDYT